MGVLESREVGRDRSERRKVEERDREGRCREGRVRRVVICKREVLVAVHLQELRERNALTEGASADRQKNQEEHTREWKTRSCGMPRHRKEGLDIAGAERWTVSHGASPRQRYLNAESLSRQTHPSHHSTRKHPRSTARERGASKNSRKHSVPKKSRLYTRNGLPGEIRTPDPRLRRPMLWSS
jgi:hypothetical protein